MTLASVFNLPANRAEYVTPYFDEKLMDPIVWTFPVTDKGIDGIELLEKEYGLWKTVKKQNIKISKSHTIKHK